MNRTTYQASLYRLPNVSRNDVYFSGFYSGAYNGLSDDKNVIKIALPGGQGVYKNVDDMEKYDDKNKNNSIDGYDLFSFGFRVLLLRRD